MKNFSSTINYKNGYNFEKPTTDAPDDMTTEEVTASVWKYLNDEGLPTSEIQNVVTVEVEAPTSNDPGEHAADVPLDLHTMQDTHNA